VTDRFEETEENEVTTIRERGAVRIPEHGQSALWQVTTWFSANLATRRRSKGSIYGSRVGDHEEGRKTILSIRQGAPENPTVVHSEAFFGLLD
jgi:hypothetical protein